MSAGEQLLVVPSSTNQAESSPDSAIQLDAVSDLFYTGCFDGVEEESKVGVGQLLVAAGLVRGESERWREEALCAQVDSEMFFSNKGESVYDAKRVCGLCAVRQECLDFALALDENPMGIWAGLGPEKRRQLRAKRLADVADMST